MISTERILCKFCPKFATRFLAGVSTPINPFFMLRSHIQSEHPEEYSRIEDYLRNEVIVKEGE